MTIGALEAAACAAGKATTTSTAISTKVRFMTDLLSSQVLVGRCRSPRLRRSAQRDPCDLVRVPDVVCGLRLEPAEAGVLGSDVGRAQMRCGSSLSLKPIDRGFDPRAVAARQVALHEVGRHRRPRSRSGGYPSTA